MEQPKHPHLWAWSCLLALVLLGLFNKCLNAQIIYDPSTLMSSDPPPNPFIKISTGKIEVVPVPILQGKALATTTCTEANRPVFLVLTPIVNGPVPLYNHIVGHEMVHSKQIERFKKKDCRGFMRWVNDTTDRERLVIHEAEAFCTSLIPLDNLTYSREFGRVVDLLFENYALEKIPRERIASIIKDRCLVWSRRSYGPP
jgi:hypothetical protein